MWKKRTVSTLRRFKSDHDDGGFLKRRLEQLKEENTVDKSDPLVQILENTNHGRDDLKRIYDTLPQKEFESIHKTEIQYSQLGDHVNRHAKEIAISKPWTGEEPLSATSLRMLTDSIKEIVSDNKSSNLGFTFSNRAARERNGGRSNSKVKDRLEAVQDNIIDYKLSKRDSVEQKEASQFRTLYAEKFTPIGSFEKLRSVAEVRIEESMKRGEFDSLSEMRGKNIPVTQPMPHLDRTEHHLNDILVRQKVVPPWIEKQNSVNKDISEFRKRLHDQFRRELIYELGRINAFDLPSLDAINSTPLLPLNLKLVDIEAFKSSIFRKWREKQEHMIESKIKTLNNHLRSYNLQSPLSSQKFYLLVAKEVGRVYEGTDIYQVFSDEQERRKEEAKSSSGSSAISNNGAFSIVKNFKFW